MNEQQITTLIQQILTQQSTVNQFAVPNTPYHTHNGLDSYFLPLLSNLSIWGYGTMVAGNLYITDPRILSTSTCLALRKGSAGTAGGFAQLAAGYVSGTTFRVFEGSFSATWDIFYLIIF